MEYNIQDFPLLCDINTGESVSLTIKECNINR